MADPEREERKRAKQRVVDLIALIYADGYAEGLAQVARQYEIQRLVPIAGVKMPSALEVRIDLGKQLVDRYVGLVESRAAASRVKGLSPEEVYADLLEYARRLADNKAELIAQTEFAQARYDAAGHLMDETGVAYEWRFPHFELGTPGHEECPICEAIREGSPYTSDQAENEGYPSVPHPNCDHGWVLVPKGDIARSEEFRLPALGTVQWPA
jgi:hypothetical protein